MTAGRFEIDHVFMFTAPGARAESERLKQAGLVESNRRRHVGQGTANACYCFDNAYLELLWAVDATELSSPAVSRTKLAERSRWRETGASPFGIAVRPITSGDLPFATWDYDAPFFPPGLSLPVATASDDPRQPMLFQSPGTERPDRWTNGRDGGRQKSAGLAEIVGLDLSYPVDVAPDPAFVRLASDGLMNVGHGPDGPAMVLALSRGGARQTCTLTLPDCVLNR